MKNSRLVYSTEGGRVPIPPKERKAERAPSSATPDDGVVRLFREKGGRGGKVVTVVRGLPKNLLPQIAADLRRLCGAGGTVKDEAVEVQGDHRERIDAYLRDHGYRTKLAGG